MSDETKKLVLARRARFIAAAIAGMTISCGKETAPRPCLDVADEDASVPPTPQPCLTATVPRKEAAPPEPCLSVAIPHDAGTPPKKDAAK